MNIPNCGPRVDYTMKRSFISQAFQGQNMHGAQNRTSTTKRSSFTGVHEYPSNIEHPKTPKAGSAIPFSMDNYSVASHYYHQSNYVNHHQYPIQQVHPQPPLYHQNLVSASKVEPSLNKIEAFTLEQKKARQPTIEERIKQITQKLDKTISQVQKHQELLKNTESSYSPQITSQSIAKIIQETIQQQQRVKQIENTMHINLIKNEIENIKSSIHSFPDRNEVQDRISKVGSNINKTLEVVNKELMDYLNSMTEMQTKNRRKEMDKVKFDLEYQIGQLQRTLQEKTRREKDDYEKLTECSSYDTLPGRKVFVGDPMLVKIATKVSVVVKSCTREIEEQETVYKVDQDGYLLDSQGRYIVNSKYDQIRLSPEQLDLLRDRGLIK